MCGSEYMVIVPGLLLKCPFCGYYKHIRTAPASTAETTTLITQEPSATPRHAVSPIDKDMQTFIDRMAEKLTPLQGLDNAGRARCLGVRSQIQRDLTNVFLGREDFNKWYDRTRTNFALHNTTFMQIIADCLKGLKSAAAQDMRREYLVAIKQIQRA